MAFVCTICSDNLESTQGPCACIPCGHTFHKKCIVTWLNVGGKCPICSRITKKEQILSPVYLSSDGDTRNRSNEELQALAIVAKLQKRDKEDALNESRIANKYLKEELKRQEEVISTMAISHAESLLAVTKNRDKIKVELIYAEATIKTKEAEIEKLKMEAQKHTKFGDSFAAKPSPFGSTFSLSGATTSTPITHTHDANCSCQKSTPGPSNNNSNANNGPSLIRLSDNAAATNGAGVFGAPVNNSTAPRPVLFGAGSFGNTNNATNTTSFGSTLATTGAVPEVRASTDNNTNTTTTTENSTAARVGSVPERDINVPTTRLNRADRITIVPQASTFRGFGQPTNDNASPFRYFGATNGQPGSTTTATTAASTRP